MNPATENPAVLQVVNRGIDLIQRVSMRDEVVRLELAFAVPAKIRSTESGITAFE